MFLETYPKSDAWQKKRELNIVKPANDQSSSYTYLYIGKSFEIESFIASSFKSGHCIPNLNSAKIKIEDGLNEHKILPDIIIVDILFNKEEYTEFFNYLQKRNLYQLVSVVFNENKLNINEINFLKYNELVDDVINIQNRNLNINKKVSFLKRLKKHSGPLQIRSSIKKEIVNTDFPKKSMFLKRIFDIIISSIILIACLPLFLIIAIAIKLESRGPVFYISHRAGRGFRIFDFYKFRTMEVGADKKMTSLKHLNKYANNGEGVTFLKIYNDPRVTKVGKFLRKTSLDELPQLINVLKGDMSVVGNRPLPIYEATTLTTNDFVERFMAPAGITGLWQVKKKNAPNMTAEERIELDISYARHFNLFYDFKIIAKTPGALFQKSNF